MKTILSLLFLAVLALLFDLDLAALGLAIVAAVLLIGDLAQSGLPESACTHNCNQRRTCTCWKSNCVQDDA
jgi:hypothetical protein